jgi:hypothetical protein
MKFSNKINYHLVLVFCAFISKGQDSLRTQDPQPVVITQEGYSGPTSTEEIPLKDLTLRQRLHFGGGIGQISFGNPSSFGISPMIGYQTTPKLVSGVGLTYQYYKFKINTPTGRVSQKDTYIGYNAFARYDIDLLKNVLGGIFFIAQYEQTRETRTKTKFNNAMNIGLGMGRAAGGGLTVMYDLNWKSSTSFTNSPISIGYSGFFF